MLVFPVHFLLGSLTYREGYSDGIPNLTPSCTIPLSTRQHAICTDGMVVKIAAQGFLESACLPYVAAHFPRDVDLSRLNEYGFNL